jgi:hypothetical protein
VRPLAVLTVISALAFGCIGCSNDSGTTGPQTMPVKLDVRVYQPLHPVIGAMVLVANLNAVTDTSGLAVFHTDINTLVPNHTYKITAIAATFVQAFPEADTIRIPSSPNEPSGYFLYTTVQMMPKGP